MNVRLLKCNKNIKYKNLIKDINIKKGKRGNFKFINNYKIFAIFFYNV